MPLFKVWNAKREIQKAVLASSFSELVLKGE